MHCKYLICERRLIGIGEEAHVMLCYVMVLGNGGWAPRIEVDTCWPSVAPGALILTPLHLYFF